MMATTHLADDESLESISGLSSRKADALRTDGYESVKDLQRASVDDIADVEGFGSALAARVKADVGNIETEDAERTVYRDARGRFTTESEAVVEDTIEVIR
ncbi:helix-hairpin-helix domain-containing protein [Halobacteria archaeon AArc-m2/3/4]|uniref:Helix-hairpin-helix domain-containing protein n=1 Tax=Natronoglomus mannanivorans TaxID=2979990 RepID=A0ABT2QAX3_9EURY|nr:helix-hairpin-helix domain-containing protein [Halobacteria archaeon AArc-m2/3/4]